ncbi:RagB/SusD family nutrient uptake outer membrane protein [Yeosuana marina]|uniref:RagB/SusD family nutrient uptake outer membrane protein n=1 Tax=Yeosuana marina TaxID=1565536 RepID=UPI0030EB7B77|tara:strand:+ start:5847 stop:7394 length:1548 start_codon:yes stop_codon:yes gene_type:complete
MKKITTNFNLLFSLLAMAVLASCTNLDLIASDSIVSTDTGGGFTGVEDPAAALTGIYGQFNGIYGTQENVYALEEVSSDEYLVPTRGTDWGDNGIWRTLHLHSWTAGHTFILQVWNSFNQMAYNCNEVIDARSNATAEQVAEAKFLRAYATWEILDNFGQVPFREVDEGPSVNPKVLSNTEALAAILDDLDAAIPDLPSVGPTGETIKASKAAAYFLKARVLLNAGIYRGGTSPEAADMPGVIAAVDAITAEGFTLHDGYFEMFDADAESSERIFYCNAGQGSRTWKGLHYSQIHPDNAGGGWNGFTTLAAFYDSFEGDPNSNYVGDGQEERRGWVPDATNANATNNGFGVGFLIGQQYGASGNALDARGGKKLIFTRDLPGLVGNSDVTGIRVLKYSPANGAYPAPLLLFRYSDAYLMKAEAMMRSGDDVTTMVNTLRTLRKAAPLGSVTEADMLAERGRELYDEHVRRMDLIRFNKFSSTWEFKDNTDETKRLFPIPTNAILSNPNLVQNPGY